ncbi:flavodoxin-like protein [Enterococcus casseliflavus ATCC 12755]|uniref:FMN dependent NADH:quinone oxidoreductase n=1 Tax=Enterococcus casseliflavus ATCC 12755 TaxID=888066 RepID=F0EH98_ENTCA|nr:NAD(P)H-dependent oxidoreductase [Enterococcus casseliflavus]EGC70412.1 flavodoxin-like protein [Enterococcus casseliflavus ATCC 12755]
MKTLLINSHPEVNKKTTYSSKLQDLFLGKFHEQFDPNQITTINLYDMDIPRVEQGQLLAIWEKKRVGESLTQDEMKIDETSTTLLQQFKDHHRIVIVSPLHNFNVTSRLKDYMDNILIARETFKYTETGSVGLMVDDYKILFLQASGSIYTNDDRYSKMDFSYNYLKQMFEEIMGFSRLGIVRAQGTALLSESEIMMEAKQMLNYEWDLFV